MPVASSREVFGDEPTCPHCGEAESSMWELDLGDGEEAEIDCSSCGKPFVAGAFVSVTYTTEPASVYWRRQADALDKAARRVSGAGDQDYFRQRATRARKNERRALEAEKKDKLSERRQGVQQG